LFFEIIDLVKIADFDKEALRKLRNYSSDYTNLRKKNHKFTQNQFEKSLVEELKQRFDSLSPL